MESWEYFKKNFDPNNIIPYNFEPYLPDSGESGEGGSGDDACLSPPAEPETIAAVTIREWDQLDEKTAKWRLKHFVWCRCGGKCRQMTTVHESVCCHDLVEAEQKGVGNDILCLTEHDRFKQLVLDKDLLKIFMVQKKALEEELKEDDSYDDDDDDDDYEAPEIDNGAYWLQAYSNCSYFLHNMNEKCVGSAIPSCVVQAINEAFP
ncbi:PREDICTED: uncharacterized protein LOC109463938 [Branchiostoma belcheri]|uniref:Uncharacterized protein LOC109463938 n=1 Tax=Branchiostoma belcheri TaxID=7741 RepID=A0A6P4XIL8_BRABE|nr:PREDICTED: uncharacterized protein LOC109463938 [Branchiostoma belcheri]